MKKNLDLIRYENKFRDMSYRVNLLEDNLYGAITIDKIYRAPYLFYETNITKLSVDKSTVLELGCGCGVHTGHLIATFKRVTALDISIESIKLLTKRYFNNSNILCCTGNMESLPFADSSFDLVTSAGALSYGDNVIVCREIKRVLKADGVFICVDSLNHNPIYKLNRLFQWICGRRSFATIRQMPSLKTFKIYEQNFKSVNVNYFGSITWLSKLLIHLIGENQTAHISDYFDRMIGAKRSAFKFVLVAKK